MQQTHPRTTVVDIVTKDHRWQGPEVYELADVALSATSAGIKNSKPLANFDEYKDL